MGRLIDAEKLKRSWIYEFDHRRKLTECIDGQPTVNAVEVVRCRVCQYYHPNNGMEYMCDRQHFTDTYPSEKVGTERKPDDFCSSGERKDGGEK